MDVPDQRVSTYSRLMRGSVWYYKLFFYVVEVCLSNAHILENKSLIHTTRNGLQFRRSLVDELTQQQIFRKHKITSNSNPTDSIQTESLSPSCEPRYKIHMQGSPTMCGCCIQLCSMWIVHVSRAMISEVPHPEGLPLQ